MTSNFSIKERSDGLFFFHYKDGFTFESGKEISELILAYECYGELNEAKDNVILIHHALSGSSHVTSHKKNRSNGWWDDMVGPGNPIDTDSYFVICINNLGGCYGSTGPTTLNPDTNRAYQTDFPIYTFKDIAESQKILLDCLGFTRIKSVIGSSVGAMVTLQMVIMYPDLFESSIMISSTSRAYASNIANRLIQSRIIKTDPEWKDGYYVKNPIDGLRTARKLALYTYRSSNELDDRFKKLEDINIRNMTLKSDVSEVERYLLYNAEKFVKKFDANSYLFLLKAMDLYDITDGLGKLPEDSVSISTRVRVISVNTDILFPPKQQEETYSILKPVSKNIDFIEHVSDYGHDTFLIEIESIGKYIVDVLEGK
jgi:homoserine O-acetyltransferase